MIRDRKKSRVREIGIPVGEMGAGCNVNYDVKPTR